MAIQTASIRPLPEILSQSPLAESFTYPAGIGFALQDDIPHARQHIDHIKQIEPHCHQQQWNQHADMYGRSVQLGYRRWLMQSVPPLNRIVNDLSLIHI